MKTLKNKTPKTNRTLVSVLKENKELKFKIDEQKSVIGFLIEWRKRKVREI